MIKETKIVFTTSWDDGSKFDIRLQDMLSHHGIGGTFYIPKNYSIRSLREAELKELAEHQEVGAHSLNHLNLTKVSIKKAREEISGSKNYLEELLGREVKMFCYPGGYYNSEVKNQVKEAGFLGARTTKEWSFGPAKDFFEMPTSLHIYPFPFRPLDSKRQYKNPKNFLAPLLHNCPDILKRRLGIKPFLSWRALAQSSFLYAKEHGKLFHLFGHSWEVERYGMWQDLEKFFKFVSKQEDIIYLTNSETIEFFSQNT